MNSVLILSGTLVFFGLAYKIYGRFLNRLYRIHPDNKTPAHTKFDGTDFVPAKNWLVLFGHHFSSICGAGPIVGPVLAVAYWGWLPSLLWLLLGSTLMGAVADTSSLVVSMRSGGDSISEIAEPEISHTARLLFSWFIWLALILIIAVFSIFAAKTFVEEPSAIAPSMGLIPVAVLTGLLLYRTRLSAVWPTLLGLGLLVFLMGLGQKFPAGFSDTAVLSAENIWILVLLIYCLVASVTPVNLLLQPRDYLASYLLFFTIGIGVVSIFVMRLPMDTTVYHAWDPSALWPGSGPLFPMLFVTIACGAISGFHSLVSSGTTCKQIASETHACRIGYGGMLTEGLVGAMVVVCVAAGLSQTELTSTLKTAGPIAAFSKGYGNLSSFMLGGYGKAFSVLALNAFILTTLDTATRIGRYLTSELFHIRNKYTATLIVVVAAALLAMTGQWNRIWPAFGSANQLIGGLSLLTASCWLVNRAHPAWTTLIPACFMLVTTISAFVWQILASLKKEPHPDFLIAGIAGVLMILALIVFKEAVGTLRRKKKT
ncbi:MAG: carbon starvation protein A [Deltaproteobacteria bacterium]|nr:carbon starvation protein A [Deltaproteobacteria bacterium]